MKSYNDKVATYSLLVAILAIIVSILTPEIRTFFMEEGEAKVGKDSVPYDLALIHGISNSLLWNIGESPKKLPLSFKKKNYPHSLVISEQSQTSFPRIVLLVEDEKADETIGLPLACNFGHYEDIFTENIDYTDVSMYFQVGEHDFDQDGSPEIVVAFGDRLVSLAINIFKLYPSKNNTVIGDKNIKLVGKFTEGQSYVFVKKNEIVLPIGGQGLFIEYQWIGNGFKRTE